MKKVLALFLIFSFVYFISGCEKKQMNIKDNLQDIVRVNTYNSDGFGRINYNSHYLSFETDESLEIFKDVLKSASKEMGMVDMSEPEFDFEVIYNNGSKQGFHLWLGSKDKISSLIKIDDSHTLYRIPKNMTNELIGLLRYPHSLTINVKY